MQITLIVIAIAKTVIVWIAIVTQTKTAIATAKIVSAQPSHHRAQLQLPNPRQNWLAACYQV